MDILIAGAGSIGTVVGTLLADAHDITFLRRTVPLDVPKTIVSKITGIISKSNEVTLTNIENLSSSTKPFEIIYIVTQAQDTASICEQIKHIVNENTTLVSLQNGIRSEEMIRIVFPTNPLILGSLWWPATLLDDETVYYGRVGWTIIGIAQIGQNNDIFQQKLQLVYGHLNSIPNSSFNCEISEDIRSIQYQKLVLNIMAPISALVKKSSLQSLYFQEISELAHYLFDEALDIIAQEGVTQVDRLDNIHKYLKSAATQTNFGESEFENGDPGKTSTEISTEKYGGKGSNVKFLLGELEEIAKKHEVSSHFISEVRSKIESLSPKYSPVSAADIKKIVISSKPPICQL